MIFRKTPINFIKALITLFLMFGLSSTYAKKQVTTEAEGAEVSTVCNASVGCDIVDSRAENINDPANACAGIENCVLAASSCDDSPKAAACNSVVSDDERDGGVEQEFIADNCKVTIYKNGPVRMVDVNTDEPCDGPIPADHKFSKEPAKVYEKDGCTITTFGPDGMMDCSKKSKRRQ